MKKNSIIVYDFETGDKDPKTTEPIEIAAIVLDRETLNEIASFESMCRPEDMSLVKDDALRINKKTRPQIEAARPLKDVWSEFVEFCCKHKAGGQRWDYPIMAGHNIINFDNIICDRMNERYGVEKFSNDFRFKMFQPQYCLDTFQISHVWFEGAPDHMRPKSFSLDNIREFSGMKTEDTHSALPDVRDTARWLVRFLKMFRHLSNQVKFEGIYA